MNFNDESDFNKSLLDNLFKDKENSPETITTGADELILIVDISGSMHSIRDDAQGGINAFIDGQKDVGEANLTIVEFDDTVSVVFERQNIKTAPEYKLNPRHSTALYDAIGFTLANAESLNPTGKVVVAIVTDGAENASSEYTQEIVFNRIAELEDKGWEFLFLSADQDAFGTGAGLGIGKTISYAANSIGTQSAYDSVSAYTTSFRAGASDEEATRVLRKFVADADGVESTDEQ